MIHYGALYLRSNEYLLKNKDNYLFKTVYMFDNELSLTLLDLGQISMVDNSNIYYFNNARNFLKNDNISIFRLKEELEDKKLLSLKYLYNLTNIPFFLLRYLSIYYEQFYDIKNKDSIINQFLNKVSWKKLI